MVSPLFLGKKLYTPLGSYKDFALFYLGEDTSDPLRTHVYGAREFAHTTLTYSGRSGHAHLLSHKKSRYGPL